MNIYVGNLDFKVKEEELKELFSTYQSVSSVKIITDKMSGASRGFGFVTIDDSAEAAEAIKTLDGSSLAGKKIVVNEAKPRKTNY
jgi:RNA recognition motif-containing protein